jgi:hypothetical protein
MHTEDLEERDIEFEVFLGILITPSKTIDAFLFKLKYEYCVPS